MLRVLSARHLVVGAALLALLIVGAALGTPVSAQSDVVKVGVLAPLSGPTAGLGEALRQGVELGVEVVNERGGFAGRQVQVIIEDDRGDPATAVERARKLIEGDGVDILMGTVESANTLAVIPVVNANKIPFVYQMGGEAKTCIPGNKNAVNPYVFGTGHTPEMLWDLVEERLFSHGDRWFFLGNDYVFPRTINAIGISRVQARGGQVLGEQYVPLGTTNFATLIAQIERARPDVVWNALVGGDAIAFSIQANQFGLYDMGITFASDSAYPPDLYGGLMGSVEGKGIIAIERYAEELDNEENREFAERFRAKFNVPDNIPISPVAAGGGYGTLMILKAAADKAGSVEADALRAALEGLRVRIPQGEVVMNADNHLLEMPLYVLEITPDGRYQVIDSGVLKHDAFVGCSVE